MAVYEIPLSAEAQTFRIQLAGVTYRMTLRWTAASEGGWVLDISDSTDVPVVQGIPLITGADLLAQYRHLGFSGSLVVQTDYDPDTTPTYANLGSTSHLYFVTA